jgi:hypothetical protein
MDVRELPVHYTRQKDIGGLGRAVRDLIAATRALWNQGHSLHEFSLPPTPRTIRSEHARLVSSQGQAHSSLAEYGARHRSSLYPERDSLNV